MTAYLTKNPDGVVFLWNNKPKYNKHLESYMAWESGHEGERNEIGINVTNNEYFRNIFPTESPCAIKIELNIENIDIIKFEDVLEETSKENEDEKIIKTLKQAFSEFENFFTTFDGIKIKDIIKWLEKQNEPKDKGEIKPM